MITSGAALRFIMEIIECLAIAGSGRLRLEILDGNVSRFQLLSYITRTTN